MATVESSDQYRGYVIKGTTMLLMHSAKLADPDDPEVEAFRALIDERKRKGSDRKVLGEQIRRLEWQLAMYHDPDFGPYIDGRNIKAAIRDAAKAEKMGSHVTKFVSVKTDRCYLLYDGPRDVDGMWERAGDFVDIRAVAVQKARTMRVRPKFKDWSMRFVVRFKRDSMNPDDLDKFIADAGWVGVGDGRAIDCGQFKIDAIHGSPTDDQIIDPYHDVRRKLRVR